MDKQQFWRQQVFRAMLRAGICLSVLAAYVGESRAGAPPIIDWETSATTPRTDTADYSPYVNPQFVSTKSLGDTTVWLKRAIERYGDVPSDARNPGSSVRVSNVRFEGCSMQWVERRSIDGGSLVQEHAYKLALRDVSQQAGGLQVARQSLRVSVSSPTTPSPLQSVEQTYRREGGALKLTGERRRSDDSFSLPLQDKDDIARRIGTALIHAARLCGTNASSR
jgi:hypothetical protein